MSYYASKTVRGYFLADVASALQKAIRRGDARLAGYFAVEMFMSGFDEYCWKRLLTVSAEDCWGILTQEVKALYDSYHVVNTPRGKTRKGRIFLAKAAIVLATAKKSRDADHLTNFVYDRSCVDAAALLAALDEAHADPEPIPGYAYDVHTAQGRKQGKTKAQFFVEEQAALVPRAPGLFDDVLTTPEPPPEPLSS